MSSNSFFPDEYFTCSSICLSCGYVSTEEHPCRVTQVQRDQRLFVHVWECKWSINPLTRVPGGTLEDHKYHTQPGVKKELEKEETSISSRKFQKMSVSGSWRVITVMAATWL